MIVIGADAHKQTHTLVAADAATGELCAQSAPSPPASTPTWP